MKDLKKWFGERVKECRKGLGVTQEILANRTGISRPNISRIEAGKHHTNTKTAAKIFIALRDLAEEQGLAEAGLESYLSQLEVEDFR